MVRALAAVYFAPKGSTSTVTGSPAINASPADANCPATDQRGVTRPEGPACDIGAFELKFTFLVPLTDFNGDGRADLVWHYSTTGQVYVWLMNGVTLQTLGSPGTVADLAWQIVGVGDVDGDGKADLVWHHSTLGQVYVWLMNGLTAHNGGSPGTVPDLSWQIVGVGDVDGGGAEQ